MMDDYYRKGLALAQDIDDISVYGCYLGIAEADLYQGRVDRANQNWERALGIVENSSNGFDIGNCLKILAKI
jgi:tetratricopeptide (TPR) repeat protein